MITFFENTIRFLRFFIASILGLVLVITKPIVNIIKRPAGFLLVLILIFTISLFLYLTLEQMLGI